MHSWASAIADFDTYLAAAGRPASTRRTRREHLQLVARDLGRAPWELTPGDLLEWFAALAVAPETRRSRRSTLRAFYQWGVEFEFTTINPALALPMVKATEPCPRPTPDRVYALAVQIADERTRLMIRLAGEAGLRRAEVAQVHKRDLVEDLVGWSLLVHGKGGRKRIVPLPDSLAPAVRRAVEHGYAFPGAIDGHLSPRRVGELVATVLEGEWTMHKLRHRFATRAYAVDRDAFTVQQLLGHASASTTRAYVALDDSALRRTVNAAAA